LARVLDIGIAVGPSAAEETGLDLISGPRNTAVLTALVLTLAAGCLSYVDAELAGSARHAGKESLARVPDDDV
jgi:hypothetical protein